MERTGVLGMALSATAALSLFSAEGERRWVAGWNPRHLYPVDSGAGEGTVFQTTKKDIGTATWIQTRHEPARGRATFLCVVAEHHAAMVDIVVASNGEGRSRASVAYRMTSLSSGADDFVMGGGRRFGVAALEDMRPVACDRDGAARHLVQIVSTDWIGQQAVNVVDREPVGDVWDTTQCADNEFRLEMDARGRTCSFDGDGRRRIELQAVDVVMTGERRLRSRPERQYSQKVGNDIALYGPDAGRQRSINVKGRVDGARTVKITRQELTTSLHKPETFILRIIQVSDGVAGKPQYLEAGLDDQKLTLSKRQLSTVLSES